MPLSALAERACRPARSSVTLRLTHHRKAPAAADNTAFISAPVLGHVIMVATRFDAVHGRHYRAHSSGSRGRSHGVGSLVPSDLPGLAADRAVAAAWPPCRVRPRNDRARQRVLPEV